MFFDVATHVLHVLWHAVVILINFFHSGKRELMLYALKYIYKCGKSLEIIISHRDKYNKNTKVLQENKGLYWHVCLKGINSVS